MKIAVIGAGAIGCLVAGYLKLKNQDVTLVGKSAAVSAIRERGIRISGVRGSFVVPIDVAEHLHTRPDLTIVATKMRDIGDALTASIHCFRGTTILTTQNGIDADQRVAWLIPREQIVSSIVMFGATCLKYGNVTHDYEGDWILGAPVDGNREERLIPLKALLEQTFPVRVSSDINGMKYLKIFLNANNCVPAILGLSIQEAFGDPSICGLGPGIWREGMEVVSNLGIKLSSLPGFSVEHFWKLTSLPPREATEFFSGFISRLGSKPLYGTILQSIKRGRPSEIDHVNGVFVELAERNNLPAPLNKRLVAMVHEVERTGRFYTKDELLRETRDRLTA